MKRYLSLFLVAALLISCLTITAFADDYSLSPTSYQKSMVDLLCAKDYTFYGDGIKLVTEINPSRYLGDFYSEAKISWQLDAAPSYSGFIFTLYSRVVPSSVFVSPFSGFSTEATFIKSSGYFHYYQVSRDYQMDTAVISVIANYSEPYKHDFGLVSFLGLLSDSEVINTASWYYDIETQGTNNVLVSKRVGSGSGSLTVSSFYKAAYFYTAFFSCDVTVPGNNGESVSFSIATVGAATEFSVALYSSGGTYKYNLPVEVTPSVVGTYSINAASSAMQHLYTVNCDLSGVDLTNCKLRIKVVFEPTWSENTYVSYASLIACAFRSSTAIVPWYVRFYSWMKDTMLNGYQSIVDAIKGDEDSEMNQATDQMEGAANDLKESSNAFEQVETPDIDAGALTGDLTNFSVSGLAVLGVITANPYVTSLLVLVFTFALCAYIFFGKKKG